MDTPQTDTAVEPHLIPAPLSQRSSSFSSISTRTPPSTPATSRTETVPSRPRPPRRHTEKATLHGAELSMQCLPPFTHRTSLDYPGLGAGNSDPYAERSYLAHSLLAQGERAKRLMQRMADAEKRLLLGGHGAGEARKLRKQLRLLKKKMDDSAQQERLTVLRLGDLHLDILHRERWVQLQQLQLLQFEAAMALHEQQQQQQPYYPRAFAPATSRTRPDAGMTISTETETETEPVPPGVEVTSPPPPPPPTAASCFFSALSPVSPGSSCLSPLSPSFVPGLPLEENFFWSVGHQKPAHGDAGDANGGSGHGGKGMDDRGRSHTPAGPAPSRTTSVPRPLSCAKARGRRASVPAVRLAWADEVVAAAAAGAAGAEG